MADLQYTLGLDGSSFATGVRGALAGLGDLNQAFELVKKLGAGLNFGISIAAQAEKTETGINTILKSTTLTKAVMQELNSFAASTPFEMPGIAIAAKQLLGAGTSVGSLRGELQVLGDVAAGADTDMAGLVTVLNQVRGKGRLMADDFQQFTERGVVGLRQELAKIKGIAVSDVSDAMSKGSISADDLYASLKSLTAQGGIFYGAMINQSKTWDGLMSTLSDNALGLVRTFAMPTLDALKPSLEGAIRDLGAITRQAEIFTSTLSLASQNNKLGEFLGVAVTLGLKQATVSFVTGFSEATTGLANLLHREISLSLMRALDALPGIEIDVDAAEAAMELAGVGKSFSSSFIASLSKDIPELKKQMESFMQAGRLKLEADKTASNKAMEDAKKAAPPPASGSTPPAASMASPGRAGAGSADSGGEDGPRKRKTKMMGFSREKAGLGDGRSHLDQNTAAQIGGRGERKFGAFYQGSDRRFDKGPRQTSVEEAVVQAKKVKNEGGAAFNTLPQRLLSVPGTISPQQAAGAVAPAVASGGGAAGAAPGGGGGDAQILNNILRELQRIRTE